MTVTVPIPCKGTTPWNLPYDSSTCPYVGKCCGLRGGHTLSTLSQRRCELLTVQYSQGNSPCCAHCLLLACFWYLYIYIHALSLSSPQSGQTWPTATCQAWASSGRTTSTSCMWCHQGTCAAGAAWATLAAPRTAGPGSLGTSGRYGYSSLSLGGQSVHCRDSSGLFRRQATSMPGASFEHVPGGAIKLLRHRGIHRLGCCPACMCVDQACGCCYLTRQPTSYAQTAAAAVCCLLSAACCILSASDLQYPTTWLHELGHNLYMNHAGSYQDTGTGALQVNLGLFF